MRRQNDYDYGIGAIGDKTHMKGFVLEAAATEAPYNATLYHI